MSEPAPVDCASPAGESPEQGPAEAPDAESEPDADPIAEEVAQTGLDIPSEPDRARASREARPDPAPVVVTAADRYFAAFSDYCAKHDAYPDGDQFARWLQEEAGVLGRGGRPLTAGHLRRYLPGFRDRWQQEHPEVPAR